MLSRTQSPGLSLRRFTHCNRAMAAVEFALVLPILLLLALGGSELGNYLNTSRRVGLIAHSIGQLLTRSTTGNVNYIDVTFARDSAIVLYPPILQKAAAAGTAWTSVISISISSVVFSLQNSSCTSNCTYKAQVAWSGGATPRPCSVNLASAADTAPPTPNTLPADTFGPGSMIVTDVVYPYVPLFGSSFLPSINITRSSYVQPRYISASTYIKYTVSSGDSGIAASCPGY